MEEDAINASLPVFEDTDGIEVDLGEDGIPDQSSAPHCQFITGEAGTGKTFSIKKKIAEDPLYGVLCASTGIAAVNLGATTINSLLGFFDTASLQDRFQRGGVQSKLRAIASKGYRNIILDEGSMTPKEQLDIFHEAITQVNAYKSMNDREPLGLIVVGDLCQLPPVVDKSRRVKGSKINPLWLFKSDCWEKAFAPNVTRLTKVWRQSNPEFLQAINFLRRGNGREAAEVIKPLTKFNYSVDQKFDGTTILATNDEVDRHNFVRLQGITEPPVEVESRRWGKQSGEWTKNIPPKLALKLGAYVMILANDSPAFTYVNGDTGHVVDFDGKSFGIKLVRTGAVVRIGKLHRTLTTYDDPDPSTTESEGWREASWDFIPFGETSYDPDKEIWHVGGVLYYPLRLAYASTVHKSQGLSLDRVQIDFRHPFFGSPSMLYVAVSRVRTPEGLRLVGKPEEFIKRCNVDPEVIPWL